MPKIQTPLAEVQPLSLHDLSNVETFLDIGANKLTALNYYARHYPSIKKLIALDIIPQRREFFDPARSEYFQVDPEAKNFPLADNSVDYINIQFVFHHFPDLESIKRMLINCHKVLKKNGQLVLWEESFTPSFSEADLEVNHQLGILTDQKRTEEFYNLTTKEKWEYIIANDKLINKSNPHMPWTGQYREWGEWVTLLKEHGFTLTKQFNFGLRNNGRVRQGVHVVGRFEKVKI